MAEELGMVEQEDLWAGDAGGGVPGHAARVGARRAEDNGSWLARGRWPPGS